VIRYVIAVLQQLYMEEKFLKSLICDTFCDKPLQKQKEVPALQEPPCKICKNNLFINKKPVITDRSLELIPGFEPGTSSLPTDRKPNVYGIFCASGMRPSRVNQGLFESNHGLLGSNEGHS